MGEMRVIYRNQPEDIVRAYQSYFKDFRDGKRHIRLILVLYSCLLAMPFVLLSMVVGAEYGLFAGITVYVLIYAACFIYGKRAICKWQVKTAAKKVGRKLAGEDITIWLTDSSIEVGGVNSTCNYKWEGIEQIERCGLLLLFKTRSLTFFVPSYAFDKKEKYEEFCDIAEKYHYNHKDQSECESSRKEANNVPHTLVTLLFPLMGLAILVFALTLKSFH